MEPALEETLNAPRESVVVRDLTNATVTFRTDLTAELSIVRVTPDRGAAPEFEPGQFTLLGLPPAASSGPPTTASAARRLVRRAYSIASTPAERRHLEFYVALVERGHLSPRLWTVPEGGRLWMDTRVSGRFTLAGVPPGADLLMVATGTGIAPFMSMLRTFHGTGRWRHAVLVHGVRRACDLAYRDELEALAASSSAFTYLPTVTREEDSSTWQGLRGRVQTILADGTYDVLVGRALDPAHWHAFLCGNPEMIGAVRDDLAGRGFSTGTDGGPRNLHFERYW